MRVKVLKNNKIMHVIICATATVAAIATVSLLTGCGQINDKSAGTTDAQAQLQAEQEEATKSDDGMAKSDLPAETYDLMQEYDAMEAADAQQLSDTLADSGTDANNGAAGTAGNGANNGAKNGAESGANNGAANVVGKTAEGNENKAAAYDDEDAVTLVMVGDILLHTPVEEAAYDPNSKKYNYDFIFANTADDIKAADVAIVNEEVIIGGEELGVSGYPSFNAPYEIGDALVNAGFDVICQATNHAMDKGAKGIKNCTAYWNESHPEIEMLGIHESAEDADELCILDVEGIKVAVLNYTYGTNGIPLPADMPYAVDELKEQKVILDIAKAEEAADFTVVIPHWGTEYYMGVSEQQRHWAKLMADNGADLIIGAHPHVIEPIEWIRGDEEAAGAKRGALCYYSLGNFVNWTSGTGKGVVNRMVGGMAKVRLSRDENGDVYISGYGIEPLVCHVESGRENVTVYKLADYNEELGERNEIRAQDPEFSYGYCMALVEEMWGEAVNGIDCYE